MKKVCEEQLEAINEFKYDEPKTFYERCNNFLKGRLDKINKLLRDDL